MEASLLKELRDLRALFEKEVVTKVKENQARVAKFEEERRKDSSQDLSIWHSMCDDDTDEESIEEDSDRVYEQDWANLGVEATLKENEAVKPAAHLQEPVPSQLDIHFTCLGPCGQRNLPRAAFSNEQVEDTLAVFGKMPKDWLKYGDRVQFAEMMDERKQRPKAMRWSLQGGAARGWSNRQQWWW